LPTPVVRSNQTVNHTGDENADSKKETLNKPDSNRTKGHPIAHELPQDDPDQNSGDHAQARENGVLRNDMVFRYSFRFVIRIVLTRRKLSATVGSRESPPRVCPQAGENTRSKSLIPIWLQHCRLRMAVAAAALQDARRVWRKSSTLHPTNAVVVGCRSFADWMHSKSVSSNLASV